MGIRTAHHQPAAGRARIDAVTRWLVVTRAAVLPMTLFAGLVAALLAVGKPGLDWRWLVLAVLGITLAHTANNLMNDLYDTKVGTDSASYPRALYAPHPVLSGLVSRRTLGLAILLVNLADLAILVTLALGPRLARGGLCAQRVRFERRLHGASAAAEEARSRRARRFRRVGSADGVRNVLLRGGRGRLGCACWHRCPTGCLCTTVLMGKHIDKIPYDEPLGIRTLPVLLGEARARVVTLAMMVGFYVLVAVAVAVGAMPWPALIVVLALPRLAKGVAVLPAPTARRAATQSSRCGRCGTPRWPGCTCARRVRCWSWASRRALCCTHCEFRPPTVTR